MRSNPWRLFPRTADLLRATRRAILRTAVAGVGLLPLGNLTLEPATSRPEPPTVTLLNRERRSSNKLVLKLAQPTLERLAGHTSHSSHSSHSSHYSSASSHSSHVSHYSSAGGGSAPSPSPSTSPRGRGKSSSPSPSPAPAPLPLAPEQRGIHPRPPSYFSFDEQGTQSQVLRITAIDLEGSSPAARAST